MKDIIEKSFLEISDLLRNSTSLSNTIEKVINQITKAIKNGNKLVLFGNGGSAADAQHIAAEFVGRFMLERESYPAIALTTDSSVITSLGNDYSYDIIFSRQCESLVVKGDVVIGISTSGNSVNVINGINFANENGCFTFSLSGST